MERINSGCRSNKGWEPLFYTYGIFNAQNVQANQKLILSQELKMTHDSVGFSKNANKYSLTILFQPEQNLHCNDTNKKNTCGKSPTRFSNSKGSKGSMVKEVKETDNGPFIEVIVNMN